MSAQQILRYATLATPEDAYNFRAAVESLGSAVVKLSEAELMALLEIAGASGSYLELRDDLQGLLELHPLYVRALIKASPVLSGGEPSAFRGMAARMLNDPESRQALEREYLQSTNDERQAFLEVVRFLAARPNKRPSGAAKEFLRHVGEEAQI
jgi:hypothetical protein